MPKKDSVLKPDKPDKGGGGKPDKGGGKPDKGGEDKPDVGEGTLESPRIGALENQAGTSQRAKIFGNEFRI